MWVLSRKPKPGITLQHSFDSLEDAIKVLMQLKDCIFEIVTVNGEMEVHAMKGSECLAFTMSTKLKCRSHNISTLPD